MKKVWMSLAVLVFVGLTYLGLKPILFPSMEGSKTIDLEVVLEDESIIFDSIIKTDAVTLGELLDEVDEFYDEINIEYLGLKTDAYGRMILAINENKTLDMSSGPWWFVESDNNTDCLTAGYCNGIDLQSIYDLDHFTLHFTSSY